jgi:catechol 2,3-dioxygenase-like lactoylglutathione lyase family enzyme
VKVIRGLAEIVLAVHDIAKAREFYEGVLGLKPVAERANPPVFLRAGEPGLAVPQMLVLVPLPPGTAEFQGPRSLHHLALEIAPEDFNAEKARLEGLGFAVRTGQHPVIPSRTMYVDDPEGNEVELICASPS